MVFTKPPNAIVVVAMDIQYTICTRIYNTIDIIDNLGRKKIVSFQHEMIQGFRRYL